VELSVVAVAFKKNRLRSQPYEHAVQFSDRNLPRRIARADLPLGGLARRYLVAAHIGFDMPQQIIDGLDPPARRAGFEGVTLAAFGHLLGGSRRSLAGGSFDDRVLQGSRSSQCSTP